MGNVLPPHDPGDGFQCCTDKAITWGVDREFVEPARHQAPIQQLMAFGGQYAYSDETGSSAWADGATPLTT
jgi:hypothetical protein